MRLSKIKRALSAVLAAALCITAVVAIPASAAKKTVWQESKELAGAKYSSKYITWVEKYSEKSGKTTVAYSKSRTKKFLDKFKKAAEKDTPQFSYSIISDDFIMYVAVKGDKFKAVNYVDKAGRAYSGNSKKITFFDITDKEKCSLTTASVADGFEIITHFAESAAEVLLDLGTDLDDKAEVFKIKSGEKTYYYEKFDDDLGFLFNESGTVLAANIGKPVCMSISYKVDNSAFNIPTSYKDVKLGKIDWVLE